jgi:hypothetical protein
VNTGIAQAAGNIGYIRRIKSEIIMDDFAGLFIEGESCSSAAGLFHADTSGL